MIISNLFVNKLIEKKKMLSLLNAIKTKVVFSLHVFKPILLPGRR